MTDHVDELASGGLSGILRQFPKNQAASSSVTSLGLIRQVYEHALEYSARAEGMGGLIMLFGLITATIGLGGGYAILSRLLSRPQISIIGWIVALAGVVLIFVGIFAAIKSVRLEFFRPEDEPTIFDRKNRKVYRIYRETHPGLKGLMRPWPMKKAVFDWDLIDCEHHATLMSTGSTISRLHSLIFVVRKSSTDSTVVATFPIGNGVQMGELTVPMVWEHIRRYMNENGPPLPPGEELKPSQKPTTFWQCMVATGPYGKNLRIWWRNVELLVIFYFLFFPIAFPVMTLIGIFRWLAVRTAVRIEWSKEVMDAVGSSRPCVIATAGSDASG